MLLRYTCYTSQKRLHIDGIIPVFKTKVSFTHTKVLTWGPCTASYKQCYSSGFGVYPEEFDYFGSDSRSKNSEGYRKRYVYTSIGGEDEEGNV